MTTPSDTDTDTDTDTADAASPETASPETEGDGAGPPPSVPADDAAEDRSRPAWRRRLRRPLVWRRLVWLPVVLLVAAALVAAGAWLPVRTDQAPANDSVDAGFARDMTTHHAQAVAMAMTEYDRGEDSSTRGVARDVALTQQREIGIMSGWLDAWDLPQASSQQPMAWMRELPGGSDHGHGATEVVSMPGLATSAELAQLASASGRAADVLFLQLMIRHHRGGLSMAQEAALTASESDVRVLARAMVVNQSAEIESMQADLRRLGAPAA